MVYDCFIFFNELDLLEVRLHELDPVVDRFVLVEANRTFQNGEKPYYFEENKKRFEKFLHKIIHIKLSRYPVFIPVINPFTPWKLETFQRNSIRLGLKQCAPSDIVLISDVDEIPRASLIADFKRDGLSEICGVRMDMFMYFFNNKLIFDGGSGMDREQSKQGIWHGMVALPFRLLRKSPNRLRKEVMRTVRRGAKYRIVTNGGWHFSYMGGIDKIIQKLESYSHAEYNLDKYKNRSEIEHHIHNGKDLFGRDLQFEIVDAVDNMPKIFSDPRFVQRHKNYFLNGSRASESPAKNL